MFWGFIHAEPQEVLFGCWGISTIQQNYTKLIWDSSSVESNRTARENRWTSWDLEGLESRFTFNFLQKCLIQTNGGKERNQGIFENLFESNEFDFDPNINKYHQQNMSIKDSFIDITLAQKMLDPEWCFECWKAANYEPTFISINWISVLSKTKSYKLLSAICFMIYFQHFSEWSRRPFHQWIQGVFFNRQLARRAGSPPPARLTHRPQRCRFNVADLQHFLGWKYDFQTLHVW